MGYTVITYWGLNSRQAQSPHRSKTPPKWFDTDTVQIAKTVLGPV